MATRGDTRREQIREHVSRSPGARTRDVAEAVGITHSTAAYHMDGLEHRGLLESVRYGNKRHWFDAGAFTAWEQRFIALALAPANARVLSAIWSRPLTYSAELASDEELSRLTAAESAKRFEELELVRCERRGRVRVLTANRDAAERAWMPLARKLPVDCRVRAFIVELMGETVSLTPTTPAPVTAAPFQRSW